MDPPAEYPCPSLMDIRGNGGKDRNLWWKRTTDQRITHTERWEKVWNPEFKLSVEQEVVDYLFKQKTGPKTRYANKGVGQKAGGVAHQIRRASLFLLMHQDGGWWKDRLSENDSLRNGKSRYAATVRMPDLSVAVALYVRELRKDTGIYSHPAFRGSWISQLSRLIEIRTFHEIELKKLRSGKEFSSEQGRVEESVNEVRSVQNGDFDYRLFWP